MILELIEVILLILGAIMLCILLSIFVSWAHNKIKDIMHRQSKIRCLCKHEYTKDWTFTVGSYTEYTLKCRKCGKTKEITIYDDK